MTFRHMALLIVVFALCVFAIPLTAFVGSGELALPELPTLARPDSSRAQPPAAAWPYQSSAPEGDSTPEALPEGDPADSARGEPTAILTMATGKTFTYLDLADNKVKTVSAQDYVRGALAAEMPASFHAEALKAQAVSAHTYALYCAEAAQRTGAKYDFTANPGNREGFITEALAKDFFGSQYDYYWTRICEAADAAFDYVMIYEGEPILAAYHASSAGVTESAENVWPNSVPYLVPVESEGDPLSPGYSTEVSFSAEAVKQALRNYFGDIMLSDDPEDWIEPLEYSTSGYILKVRVGDQEVHGSELRFALDLRSSAMDIDYDDGIFSITTTGYGHGVGLSQYGADYMARQGSTFDVILTHYYPGATLAMLAKDN